ncbi:putative transcription factor interactor and regulator C3H-WRC/GRF family [Lupinus albus]|uniref:Growth-regulating factor n=1 Tax=Lupinus albus TaxID=3870 RepID=A0A6A4PP34_LUPAL|nr:putative transcription factor interactor and regulator C3H-WRC/GRF family [Lupinus albus]
MEAKPLRSVPFSHNKTSGEESEPHKKKNGVILVNDEEKKRVVDVMVKEVNSVIVSAVHTEPINKNTLIKAPHYYHKCCIFTEAQRSELYHQVLIFNHFACNLFLNHHHHLVAAFPSYMSGYSNQGYDYGSMMMDLEPQRCRRTDGKKWRCSRNVVPNQKYCERHMHRGCNRSRKRVETSQLNSSLIINPSGKLQTKLTSSNAESAASNADPLGTRHIKMSSCAEPRNQRVADTSSINSRLKTIVGSDDYLNSFSPATAIAPLVTTFSNSTSVASDSRRGLLLCKKDNQTKSCVSDNVGVKSGAKGSIISAGIGFSPRSVLQGNVCESSPMDFSESPSPIACILLMLLGISGCNNSYINDRNNVELEPGRCRRTDGKKWRCKSPVISGQKYCANHMHRGSKRRFPEYEPAATDSAVTIAQLPCSTATTNIQKAHCSIPNTSLSMSIPESAAPLIKCNEKSPCRNDTNTMDDYSYASS